VGLRRRDEREVRSSGRAGTLSLATHTRFLLAHLQLEDAHVLPRRVLAPLLPATAAVSARAHEDLTHETLERREP
jgi:hypothetical protein